MRIRKLVAVVALSVLPVLGGAVTAAPAGATEGCPPYRKFHCPPKTHYRGFDFYKNFLGDD